MWFDPITGPYGMQKNLRCWRLTESLRCLDSPRPAALLAPRRMGIFHTEIRRESTPAVTRRDSEPSFARLKQAFIHIDNELLGLGPEHRTLRPLTSFASPETDTLD